MFAPEPMPANSRKISTRCKKCGNDDGKIEFLHKGNVFSPYKFHGHDKNQPEFVDRGMEVKKDCLFIVCNVCGYEWFSQTQDEIIQEELNQITNSSMKI